MPFRFYSLIVILMTTSVCGTSQQRPLCGSDEYADICYQDPAWRYADSISEVRYRQYFRGPSPSRRMSVVSIPVVFHIIHNNGPENISDARVLQGLEHLNQAFAGTGPYTDTLSTDTGIRFCLAQRDEQGNPFTGIVRHQSPYTDMYIAEGYEYIQGLKFNPDQYFNILIVGNACRGSDCNVAGFAGADRVVIEAQYFGKSVIDDIVIAHEVGHALGLAHTWKGGCKNEDCLSDGDRVCDTPPDNRTYEHCFAPFNSCTSDEDDTSALNPFRPVLMGGLGDQPDDHTNFMDYNWWHCAQHFTRGQADRMLFFINDRYASLLKSKACLPPCDTEVAADFILPDTIVVGQTLTIFNQSAHADVYQWYVNGAFVSASEDLVYTFITEGIVSIQLEAYTNDALCDADMITKSIRVYCPVEACFDYHIQGQYLIFEDCSQNADDIEWIAYNGKGDNIHGSTLPLDSVYVNNIDFVRLCLTAHGENCEDFICQYITINSDGSEVCGNEQDDDGDGLIDLFDPDCPCKDGTYQANCPKECEIIPDSFPDIKMKMKWESEKLQKFLSTGSSFTLIDFKNEGNVQILSSYGKGTLNNFENYLAFIDGGSGNISDTFRVYPEYSFYEFTSHYLVVNSKISSKYNIYTTAIGELLSVNTDGSEIFRNSHPAMMGVLGASDFNNDGIIEVYGGDVIFNGENGNILYVGRNRDCTTGTCDYFIPISADVVGGDDRPELITGKYVYNLNLINTSDATGNSAVVIEAPSGVEDGKCGVGDIDGDGELDVISVKGRTTDSDGGIWIWNPRSQTHIAFAESGIIIPSNPGDGSIPFIGDVDGDCFPEIGVVFSYKLNMYKYNGTPNLELLYSLSTSDESGRTGVTMFDFNQDGKQELVYRDENYLRIIEGATGNTIDSILLLSKTWLEYPIVADVDNDGQAEIIVSGSRTNKEEVRMYCFESATAPWAPARSVWNQYAYNPTQVNDDLTIPRYQQNAAQPMQGTEHCIRQTCNTPYNNFMVQATYRTQEGCYVWPELQQDISITASSKCIGDSLEICFHAISSDTTTIRIGVMVSCYPPPWDVTSGVAIQSIDEVLVTNDTTCIMMAIPGGIDSLLIVINDAGGYYPPNFPNTSITECDYTNNEFVLHLGGPDFSIDILDWECSSDSLIFYIATDNVGLDTDVSCIGGGCYFVPLNGQDEPLELTTWCFDFDSITMTYQYRDTFKVAIPHPTGHSQMWWTINEGGFGPGVQSSQATGIFECNYTNNTDSISFDISTRTLDLGPDFSTCYGKVFTLDAGAFDTYVWSDLTDERYTSLAAPGTYWVETTDQCHRAYRDTVTVRAQVTDAIDLGPDLTPCPDDSVRVSVGYDMTYLQWVPRDRVDCDTCQSIILRGTGDFDLIALAIDQDGCNLSDTLAITYALPEKGHIAAVICEGGSFGFKDSIWTSPGLYTYKVGACDSLYTIDLRSAATQTTRQARSICQGETYDFFGSPLTSAGSYSHLLTGIYGCDSTIILDLDVSDIISVSLSSALCEGDSLYFNTEWIHNSGIYSQTLASSAGCDSTVVLDVRLFPSYNTSEDTVTCYGSPVIIHDSLRTIPGTYVLNAQTFHGCDSVSTVTLRWRPQASSSDSLFICQGESVMIHDSLVSSPGLFTQTYSTRYGCDSLSQVYLSIAPYKMTYIDHKICQGDSIWVIDRYVNAPGILLDTVSVSAGCHEIVRHEVKLLSNSAAKTQAYLCPDSSLNIFGKLISAPGLYVFDQFTNAAGCDSIVTVDVMAVSPSERPAIIVHCEENTYTIIAPPSAEWWYIGPDGNGFDTLQVNKGGPLQIQASSVFFCDKTYNFDLPDIPSLSDIPTIADQQQSGHAGVTVTINLTPSDWKVLWSPSSLASCDTCLTTTITTDKDTSIYVMLTHSSGCVFKQNFRIVRDNPINLTLPNIINTSSTSGNDTWYWTVPTGYELAHCAVYDRWGNIVYNAKDQPQVSWDGTVQGKKVTQGVYIYVIKLTDAGGVPLILKGDITVIK